MGSPVTRLWVAVGAEWSATARCALARLLPDIPAFPTPVRILAGDKHLADGAVEAAIRAAVPGVVGATPPPSVAGQALAMTRSADYWRTIPLTQPGTILSSVALPATLASAASFVYLVRSRRDRRDDPLALDLLARFVHPRLVLLLRGDADRAGLTAEINVARQPHMVVMQMQIPPWSLVLTTVDPIAAELFGLAFREHFLAPDAEITGPWEDRLVQRATELDLGVTLPEQMAVTVVPCSPRFDPAHPPEEVMRVLDDVNVRLGIARPPAILEHHGE